MHGLCNRALHCFLRDRLGADRWHDIARRADAPLAGFEALSRYDDAVTLRILSVAAHQTGQDHDALLEDLGTYLVSHPSCEAVRRLLRFGGPDFPAFLHDLEDLPDRARLAVADLDLPQLRVTQDKTGYRVAVGAGLAGFAAVVAGVIRAMADDYGTLVVLTHWPDAVDVRMIEADFAKGRYFALGG